MKGVSLNSVFEMLHKNFSRRVYFDSNRTTITDTTHEDVRAHPERNPLNVYRSDNCFEDNETPVYT
jgi:hypothetical protein